VLLVITFRFERKKVIFLVFQSWIYLVPGSLLIAGGVFAWYDSVERVGASKEGLVAGPLETIAVLFLARAFLQEKLNRLQMVGIFIAIAGFFATVMSSGTTQLVITLGDIEAIFSALSFGSGIIFVTKLTKTHSALAVTAATLFVSGVVLAAILWATELPNIVLSDWMILLLFSCIPLSAALTYVIGLARIGASLTSTIASFSILLTVILQLILLSVGIQVILPSSIPLAIVGGALGVLGIYLIHRTDLTKIQGA
jgi:drug/metabolite transporter (DMT)-like permease